MPGREFCYCNLIIVKFWLKNFLRTCGAKPSKIFSAPSAQKMKIIRLGLPEALIIGRISLHKCQNKKNCDSREEFLGGLTPEAPQEGNAINFCSPSPEGNGNSIINFLPGRGREGNLINFPSQRSGGNGNSIIIKKRRRREREY